MSKLNIVERAAEQLLKSGAGPNLAGPSAPPIGDPAGSPVPLPADRIHPAPPWPSSQPPISSATLAAAGVIESTSGRGRVGEEFRLVRNQLVRAAFPSEGGEPGFSNLLMVTSAKPREGKTFTALNLAAALARQGDRSVILVDADPKPRSLSDALGLSDSPGLIELSSSPGEDPIPLLRATELKKLWILPAGRRRSESPEIFASESMVRTLQLLGREYPDRLIVLDMPPCLSTSDPAALAAYVGQIIFVVEAESTQREEVEAALDLLHACASITLLLNKVRMSTARSFGAYAYAYNS